MNSTLTINSKEQFLESFVDHKILTPSASIATERVKALEAIASLDFPNSRVEDWKYTKVTNITKSSYKVSKSDSTNLDTHPYKIAESNAHVLVFLNGFFSKELSDNLIEDKLIVKPITSLGSEQEYLLEKYYSKLLAPNNSIFSALNTAYFQDGILIYVPDDLRVEKPIHVIYLTEGDNIISQPRNLIVAGKNSNVNIIISFETVKSNKSFTNAVSEIYALENAKISIDKIQQENGENAHISSELISQESNSNCTVNTFTLKGGFVRNNLNFSLEGEGIEANLNGLYLLKDKQHVDNHTLVDHKKPNCVSNELYKGIMADKSVGVFNGKVYVRPDAQKTNAYQSNANILLSDDATINAKPELEIYADDVKCSHGSTTGQLDEEAIFYFQSRGIDAEKAKSLLLFAFASDVVEKIKIEALKEKIKCDLDLKFNQ